MKSLTTFWTVTERHILRGKRRFRQLRKKRTDANFMLQYLILFLKIFPLYLISISLIFVHTLISIAALTNNQYRSLTFTNQSTKAVRYYSQISFIWILSSQHRFGNLSNNPGWQVPALLGVRITQYDLRSNYSSYLVFNKIHKNNLSLSCIIWAPLATFVRIIWNSPINHLENYYWTFKYSCFSSFYLYWLLA